MFSKVFCLFGLLAVAVASHAYAHGEDYSSQYVSKHDGHPEIVHVRDHGHDHGHRYGHGHNHIDYYAKPKYDYEYKVEDRHTGNMHTQHESRDGDKVRGYYAIKQSGAQGSVHYHTDDHTNSHADVKYNLHLNDPDSIMEIKYSSTQ